VVSVGLQAPAVSAGLRWDPSRTTFVLPRFPLEMDMEFAFERQPASTSWLLWALAALAAAAILYGVVRWIRHLLRRATAISGVRTGVDVGAPSEADARIVRSGLAAALLILDAERSSSDAIVQAWQGLQDAAAAAGLARRPAETASEFTARILYRSRGSSEPIAVLLSLYQRVRFGHHSPNADEIAAARKALAILVDLWQSDLPERRASRAPR
jgi:Domain of unknown function (DUF4129)